MDIIAIKHLIEEIGKRFGDSEFEHTVDEVEWVGSKYNHQN